ncbi:putative Unc104-like kinesin [Trypanosoma grayi]|uniref:putative Unc104-like kinesin n=1 Tax=Trypanosoma grayi TaxID=71804 RepID=UPI0004F468C4|nr:putative Unc104-like kinesin [Trypanosoma grayi]KEG13695.1 putative Unc104-like kinesin [Trypanosoma grayi]
MPGAPEVEEGRITVCVRARPLNEREKRLKSPQCLLFNQGKTVSIYKKSLPSDAGEVKDETGNSVKVFTFDRAYDSDVGQSVLYDDLGVPVLKASFCGFNTCIFAYGQTGSGKSYSMMGPSGGRDVFVDPGIIPRLSKGLFAIVKERLAAKEQELEAALAAGEENSQTMPAKLKINVVVSYLEIYQERVYCLLNSKCENLKVREHPVLGVYVEGLTELQTDSEDGIMRLMNGGNQSRHTAATKMNDRSSRSHAIFAISLVQTIISETTKGEKVSTELRSKINLVDLAGSERAKSTGAEGDTLREGANINRSLTVLGLVISALADMGKHKTDAAAAKHVPYRDSTLTFLLKESLGGNSKTFMLSTLSPAAANYEETLSTLRYADRVKAIVTRAVVNETAGDKKIRELQEEVTRLKEKMRHYEELVGRGGIRINVLKTDHSMLNSTANDTDSGTVIEEDVDYITAQTPRQPRDAAVLEAELHRAEQFIQKMTGGEVGGVESLRIRDLYRTMPSVKVNRSEPFLLNVDGAGDWVVEYLVAGVTYLGTEAGENSKNDRYIVVSGANTTGIAPRHCCFVRQEGGCVLLRPLGGNATYINDEVAPVTKDTVLTSGTVVCMGTEYLEFKFTDPSAPQPTGRRRAVRAQEGGAVTSPNLNTNELAVSSSGDNSRTSPMCGSSTGIVVGNSSSGCGSGAYPDIPALRLKEALQRRTQSSIRGSTLHGDPMSPTGRSLLYTNRGNNVVGVTPRTTLATGRVVFAPNDELTTVYRHTFLFIGDSNSGKSALRENIQKPDKWYSIFANDKLHAHPTFGLESSLIEAPTGHHPVQINLMELSGKNCFSLLEELLPTRRVTYVLCFSLCDFPSLEMLKPHLELILCNTASRDAAVLLIGTHLDESLLPRGGLARVFAGIEAEVNNYLRLLQVHPEMRPSILGHFAVDNVNRVVFSPSVAKMRKFPELLTWFAEQAIIRCRNDPEFPNAQVPVRTVALAKKIRHLYREGKWCLSSSEYKTIAKAVNERYGMSLEDLHQHTQLLASWGVLHHHYKHHTMKKHIVVDVPWVFRTIAVLACCTPMQAAQTYNQSMQWSLPLVSRPYVVNSMSNVLPFDADAVQAADVFGLLGQGVLTMKTARVLFSGVLAEKNFGPGKLSGLLELLRSYDFIVQGSSLQFSVLGNLRRDVVRVWYENSEEDNAVGNKRNTDDTREVQKAPVVEPQPAGDATSPRRESELFVLVPACFRNQAPSALCVHLPTFLFGPFYRFVLNAVPHNFFSRVVCRIAHYAEKVYLGPVTARCVPVEDLDGEGEHGGRTGRSARGRVSCIAQVVDKSEFWGCTAWVTGSASSRALLRMVQHSLLITFHDFNDDEDFYDGLRRVVRNVISESPGVVCEESILCTHGILDEVEKAGEVHGDKTYWHCVDQNLNSLDKIRQREEFALMTARVNTARHLSRDAGKDDDDDDDGNDDAKNGNEEESDMVVPFVRNRTECIDEAASMRRICDYSLLTDPVLHGVTAALRSMNDARRRGNIVEQCKLMDCLVDALAQA